MDQVNFETTLVTSCSSLQGKSALSAYIFCPPLPASTAQYENQDSGLFPVLYCERFQFVCVRIIKRNTVNSIIILKYNVSNYVTHHFLLKSCPLKKKHLTYYISRVTV